MPMMWNMKMWMAEFTKVHFNKAQLKFWLIFAQISLLLYGRATGKTTGPGALFTSHNMNTMPQGNHGIGCNSYEKVFNEVLPKLMTTWEKMGYYRNVHYWVQSYAPKQLRIKLPYDAPIKPTNVVHWFTGACGKLISADRPNTFLGRDHDSIYLDELRKIKFESVMELVKTMRGNKDKFGHLFNHGSQLFTSDLPKPGEADWILDYEKEVDHERVELILQVQQYLAQLRQEQIKAGKRKYKALQKEIDQYEHYINELRKNLIAVLYGSTIDNVHTLGIEVIESWKRQLSDADFATTVLSILVKQHEKYFYPNFSEAVNCYTRTNEEFIENVSFDEFQDKKDCRKDDDLELRHPLYLSPDYNSKINCVVVGQRESLSRVNILSSFFVGPKKKIRGCAKAFDRYYQYKKQFDNRVYLVHDHTAVGENAKDDIDYAQEWIDKLEELGWAVTKRYIGQSPTHRSRFILTKKVFDPTDKDVSDVYINSNNNEDLIISIANAKTRVDSKGNTVKDKRDEQRTTVLPQHATHLSEAFDILVWALCRHELGNSFDFLDILSLQ